MSNTPKISVIMTCYNHENFIGESIESILNQTLTDFELIIVDDGSADNSVSIIKSYEDPRIVLLTQDNSGPSVAVNNAITRSKGEFIALMSGDDVALPHRLDLQLSQILFNKADMIFSLPEIIGPISDPLSKETCSWFFDQSFISTADLYQKLFYFPNFICAPTCFSRRTSLENVGEFHRGLIQLQDMDYWIRACKSNLKLMLFDEPILKYRYLYGENLSTQFTKNRIKIESLSVYRSFFDQAPTDLLKEAFSDIFTRDYETNSIDAEIDKSLLYLNHSDPFIQSIGAERIIRQFQDDEIFTLYSLDRGFGTPELFKHVESIKITESNSLLKVLRRFLSKVIGILSFSLREVIRWNKKNYQQRIQKMIDQEDYSGAKKLVYAARRIPPGETVLTSFFTGFQKAFRYFKKILPGFTGGGRKTSASTSVALFSLERIFDYSKISNAIAYSEKQEVVPILRPQVIGKEGAAFEEGDGLCPPAYVSIFEKARVIGGSSLVFTEDNKVLSDELVDFSSEEYGIKSTSVLFRSKNKLLIEIKKGTNTGIKEGILISSDHDLNYFHWIIECLPRLVLIDSLTEFKDIPILIPKGLHKNLESALQRVNGNNRRLIRLEPEISYKVNRLIYPSALSRINDRYQGRPIFNVDIIFSPKWVRKTAEELKGNLDGAIKPWRKLYLTRKSGMHNLQNSAEFELFLVKQGFEIVSLDDVTLDFQIELFSQAAVIVAPTGAALTNMIYCQPGTKVIILMSNHESTNYYLWPNLGRIFNLDVEIIVGERLHNITGRYSVHDDFITDVNIVKKRLRNIDD